MFESAVPGTALSVPTLSDNTWRALCYTVEREKAAIALWRHIGSALPSPPPEGAAGIQRLAVVMEFRMQYLQQRLSESVAVLRREGIACVLLKGAAIASVYHRSFVERPMLDLDILVPAAKAERAYEALLNAGWVVPTADRSVVYASGGIHHLPVLHDGKGMAVNLEVHTDLFPPGHPFSFSSNDVWRDAVPLSGLLEGAHVPSSQHLALHSCIHLSWSHMMRTGAWRAVRDLAITTRSADFDWDVFIRNAKAVRASTACFWTLELARGLIGLSVPPHVLLALAPPRIGFNWTDHVATELLRRHLLAVLIPGGIDCPSIRVRRAAWSLAIRPGSSGHGVARPWRTAHDATKNDQPDPSIASQAESTGRGWLGRIRSASLYANRLLRPMRTTKSAW